MCRTRGMGPVYPASRPAQDRIRDPTGWNVAGRSTNRDPGRHTAKVTVLAKLDPKIVDTHSAEGIQADRQESKQTDCEPSVVIGESCKGATLSPLSEEDF